MSDSNCNLPKVCPTENTTKTIDTMECGAPGEGIICDDIEYDFNHTPTQITGSWKEFKCGKANNFTRGCKWAPDGSCILTCSDDNKLRIFNLPSQLWDCSQWMNISELEAALKMSERNLIYDFCWYPFMNSNDASTCCLVSTSKNNPVRMYDAHTGKIRCSYKSTNLVGECMAPISISFNNNAEKLFCGLHNVIRIFDVNRPGSSFDKRPVYSDKTGQSGIVSCFAFTSANMNMYAVGSFGGTIGLYAESFGERLSLLKPQAHGLTQLKFSPDGKHLYSSGLKDCFIHCWDVRNLATELYSLKRSCETNQRLYFDISKCGKYVASGNHDGLITFWDVTKEAKIVKDDDCPILAPIQYFKAHNDCVNGISLHPSYPLLCSSSGQRKYQVLLDDDSEDIFSTELEKGDISLRLWWIGKLNK